MSLVMLMQREAMIILLKGGVMCDSLAAWIFNKAPYGTRIVEYKQVSEEDFVSLPNYTSGDLF